MNLNVIQLFVVQNAAVTADLHDVMGGLRASIRKSAVEIATDRLVEEHLQQIDDVIRRNAERMSEFYKIFSKTI
jgi:hypothetical protein